MLLSLPYSFSARFPSARSPAAQLFLDRSKFFGVGAVGEPAQECAHSFRSRFAVTTPDQCIDDQCLAFLNQRAAREALLACAEQRERTRSLASLQQIPRPRELERFGLQPARSRGWHHDCAAGRG